MEVVFEILFKANSLSDYKDELIIISEKNNFVVSSLMTSRFPWLPSGNNQS